MYDCPMKNEDFMRGLKSGKNPGGATRLLGQAGVWAVASQLARRGIVPLFPGVDQGFDLMLGNGIKLQVKTATLKIYGGDKRYLAYCFDCRGRKWNPETKQYNRRALGEYAKLADFFVLWGIDEDRFWIIPTAGVRGAIWFPKRDFICLNPQPGRATHHRDRALERLERTEGRWDLLDIDRVAEEVVETVGIVDGVTATFPAPGIYQVTGETS